MVVGNLSGLVVSGLGGFYIGTFLEWHCVK